ncbi:hypothetical protein ACFOWM_09720 [Ferruginibacter yonginensis]|uniref:Uncharacterized protein n=1 Tax=Ferruginibacter yonginensis TaxID=1310416 RepID=A0ABV8QTF5_9BACT
MNKNINEKIEAAMQSLDGITQAAPAPFLLTRLQSAIAQQENPTVWMRIASFLSKPAVAFSAIAVVVSLNAFIVASNIYRTEDDAVVKLVNNTKSDFAINDVSVMYDTENIEP